MAYDDKDYCPHCKGTRHTTLTASGGEWTCLLIHDVGSVTANVCLNCGTVYVSRRLLERLQSKGRPW
jgi:Zn-finger nucleic acid-binding protein